MTARIRFSLATALLLAPAAISAQALDRTKVPELAPPAELKLPAVRTATLANGITLRVVEMHEVPLVQVTLRVKGGGRLDGDLPGLATFTAGMLDEAAGARDGLGIAAEAAFLGAEHSVSADWEYLYLSLNTPRRTLGRSRLRFNPCRQRSQFGRMTACPDGEPSRPRSRL